MTRARIPFRAGARAIVSNIVVVGLLGFVVWQRAPGILANYRTEGTRLPAVTLSTLSGVPVPFPDASLGRTVLVFWATWCGPCKVELGRFARGVTSGEIDSSRFFAVDMGEARAVVEAHVAEARYPFTVVLDAAGFLDGALGVTVTPTIVYLEGDGTVTAVHSGLQPFSVSRAARFLAGREP